MFRCRLRSGCEISLALVRTFTTSKSKQKTAWDDIQINDESPNMEFMFMGPFLRGVRMSPVFGTPKRGSKLTFIFDDCTNADIYLCTQGLFLDASPVIEADRNGPIEYGNFWQSHTFSGCFQGHGTQ